MKLVMGPGPFVLFKVLRAMTSGSAGVAARTRPPEKLNVSQPGSPPGAPVALLILPFERGAAVPESGGGEHEARAVAGFDDCAGVKRDAFHGGASAQHRRADGEVGVAVVALHDDGPRLKHDRTVEVRAVEHQCAGAGLDEGAAGRTDDQLLERDGLAGGHIHGGTVAGGDRPGEGDRTAGEANHPRERGGAGEDGGGSAGVDNLRIEKRCRAAAAARDTDLGGHWCIHRPPCQRCRTGRPGCAGCRRGRW